MKVSFNRDADALYIRFSDDTVEETSEVCPDLMLDYDAKGRIVGLETQGVAIACRSRSQTADLRAKLSPRVQRDLGFSCVM